jgi:hypothetical protein
VNCLVMGGQACVFYGAAEFSRGGRAVARAYRLVPYLALAMTAFAQGGLYDYDRTTPFDYREESIRRDARIEIAGASFRSPKGGRVNMIVVRPRGSGPYAGVIYQHGGGQTMMTYIAEAEVMALVWMSVSRTMRKPPS